MRLLQRRPARRATNLAASCFAILWPAAFVAAQEKGEAPQTIHWDGDHLALLRADEARADPRYGEVFKRLPKNAEISLQRGPYSVMNKKMTPPSGDMHDYLSHGRYRWPNPDSPDGLPYVRRDGRTNCKLLEQGDRDTIGMLYDGVEPLALAGFLLNDERYSDHAALWVRTWFLDPATKMNPHLRYAQAVPGREEGRGAGIIDTRHCIRVLDAVALLRQTNAWSDEDQAALVAWLTQFLDWLRNDPLGKDEAAAQNNHGTWYDVQTATIAMFIGERDLARQIVGHAKPKRIALSIEPDGRQPEELDRTKGLHYCVFNLSAMSILARIGEHVGVDLWSLETDDGRSRPSTSLRNPNLFSEPDASGAQPVGVPAFGHCASGNSGSSLRAGRVLPLDCHSSAIIGAISEHRPGPLVCPTSRKSCRGSKLAIPAPPTNFCHWSTTSSVGWRLTNWPKRNRGRRCRQRL